MLTSYMCVLVCCVTDGPFESISVNVCKDEEDDDVFVHEDQALLSPDSKRRTQSLSALSHHQEPKSPRKVSREGPHEMHMSWGCEGGWNMD